MNVIFNAIDEFSDKYFCGCTLTTYGYVDGTLGAVSMTNTRVFYNASLSFCFGGLLGREDRHLEYIIVN